MNQYRDDIYDESTENNSSINYQDIISNVLNNWYWFLLSLILCALLAVFYLQYTTPVYEVNASVIIKDDGGKGGASSGLMNMEDFGILSSTNNFDNELVIMQSRTLAIKTVTELGLYITHYRKDRFKDVELYNNSPITVWMTPQEASKLESTPAKLTFNKDIDGRVMVIGEINEQEFTSEISNFPSILSTPYGAFSMNVRDSIALKNWEEGKIIYANVNAPQNVAMSYLSALTITSSSKTTTIAKIVMKSTNKLRGIDFINKLVDIYNRDANDDKNEVASKSAEFINERIEIINRELGTTEQELEEFKRSAGITDLQSEAQLALNESNEYNRRSVEISTQLRLVAMLSQYASDSQNEYEVMPVNIGLTDIALNNLIATYNEMILEYKRLLLSSSKTNPAVINLNTSIEAMRSNLRTSIKSIEDGLRIKETDLNREAATYKARIESNPTTEREFISISRQQEIQAQLYLMLLQKREENAITLASTANNARMFDSAYAKNFPIAPNRKLILIFALFMGCAIPIGILYLISRLKFKIENTRDVEMITSVPLIGITPYIKRMPNLDNSIVVEENRNDAMAESFRQLRTNILYMLSADQKVVLVTSTHTGEGKSYMSANLAVSMALLGKRVIVVGLDIRKPGLNNIFGTTSKQAGICSYLSGQTKDILSLVQESNISSNLSILYGGTIPPNPTELLTRDALKESIEILKDNYDYIIIDSAPVGMVTDTMQFARLVDASIYVCRANYTHKNDYELINVMAKDKRLPNLCTVVVGVDTSKKRYGYGYGYGNKYGYAYGYAQGYGTDSTFTGRDK